MAELEKKPVKIVETILRDYPQVKKIIIYSRDELKQF